MTTPLALVFYESLLPGSQLVNRLTDLNYRVVSVTQPGNLVPQVKDVRPFLIVIDLGENFDLCATIRVLKGSTDTAHIPILAFARDGQEELRSAAHAAGAALVTGDVAILAHLPQLLEQVLEIGP